MIASGTEEYHIIDILPICGNRQISIIKNGSFYNTDAGIEPAFFLDKPESFYDRPAFGEYLHELK